MFVRDLSIGTSLFFGGNNIVITDIEDEPLYDRITRTITFDIYENSLFPIRIGWSFYKFYDLYLDIDTICDFEDDEDDFCSY